MNRQYFIRFTETPERDIEQGYSLRNYLFGKTRELAAYHALLATGGFADDSDEDEAVTEWLDEHADEIVEVDGQFAARLPGLCGFGPFETAEEAQGFISEYGKRAESMAYAGLTAHIFAGQFISWDENDEGAVFRAETLVS